MHWQEIEVDVNGIPRFFDEYIFVISFVLI